MKVQITVMATCNAIGKSISPLLLFPGEMLRDVIGIFRLNIYTNKNGWMDADTVVIYLENLIEYSKEQSIEFPNSIILRAAEFCSEKGIILYSVLVNATDIMQPLDIGYLSPMKSVWKQIEKFWRTTKKSFQHF